MNDSILISVKKLLGIAPDYTVFDQDIIIHINSAIMVLNQLAVGLPNFIVTSDAETWKQFIGTDTDLQGIKTLVYLRVRLLFDPPATSFAIDAVKTQIAEYEWRLNALADPAFNPVVIGEP